jgi:hypothetical protein
VNRRRLLIASAAVGAISLVVLLWPAQPEPTYHGRRLSSWLLESGPFPSGHDQGAGEAIRQMGTNSLPCLLKWLNYQRPAWRDKVFLVYDKLPRALQNPSFKESLVAGRAQKLSEATLWTFQLLGPDAAPAVPELTRMLQDSRKSALAGRVMYCLGGIGEPARPALPAIQQFVHCNDPALSRDAIITIRRIIPDASESRSFLRLEPQ